MISADVMRRLPRWVRRGLLVLLLAWGAWQLLDGPPRVCHEEVAATAVVQVCEPIPATDARALMFLLVAGLLLLPELSELEIAGLVTLRRKVDEAQADAAQARREVAQLSARLTAAAAATSMGNQTTLNFYDRAQETGQALEEAEADRVVVDGPGDTPPAAQEPAGAFAAAAFQAGLLGLTQFLPAWASSAEVIGFTLAEDGTYEPTYVVGDPGDQLVETVSRLVNEQLETTLIDVNPRRWLAAAKAVDDAGGRVGALAVLVRDPDLPPGPDGAVGGGPEQFEELAAAVEVMAGSYARLLIDLLGEVPTTNDGAESGRSGQ
jgi:hypothetical protein